MNLNQIKRNEIIRRNKVTIFISTGIFIVAISAGYLLGIDFNEEGALITPSGPGYLFINNIKASMLISSGILTFGISTVIFLTINGTIIGVSMNQQYEEGMSIGEIFLKLAPHGILEIPALILAGVIGLKGISFIIHIYRFSAYKSIIGYFLIDVFVLILLITLLLAGAALIEWYITA